MSADGDTSAATLASLATQIAGGSISIIDLTHTLSPDSPTIVLPPELGQSAPFRMERISRYDSDGPAWWTCVGKVERFS